MLTRAYPGGLIDHAALREIAHFAQGPSLAFGNNLYQETLRDGQSRVVSVTWYTNAAKVAKIYELTYAYDAAATDPSRITTTLYESDGVTIAERYSDVITYSGSLEVSRNRVPGIPAASTTEALINILPSTANLWTADSMTAFDQATVQDQVGATDLTKTTDPTSLGPSATFNGETSLVVPTTGGIHTNTLFSASGALSIVALATSQLAGAQNYLTDGFAPTANRLITTIPSNGSVSASWTSNVTPAGSVVPNVPFLFVGTRSADGTVTAETFLLRDGLPAAEEQQSLTAGPFTGFALNGRNNGSFCLGGEWVFTAVHSAALSRAQVNAIALELNTLFGINLGLLP